MKIPNYFPSNLHTFMDHHFSLLKSDYLIYSLSPTTYEAVMCLWKDDGDLYKFPFCSNAETPS